MLCTSCQNRPHCLAAQLAQGDAALARLLSQLKHCGLKPRRPTPWQQLRGFWRFLRRTLRDTIWARLRPRVTSNG
jgi:hypothetical protein